MQWRRGPPRVLVDGTEMGRQLGAMPPNGSVGERLMLGTVNARTAATDAIRKLRERG